MPRPQRDRDRRREPDRRWDYNRDRLVNGSDLAIARDNATSTTMVLRLLSAPPGSGKSMIAAIAVFRGSTAFDETRRQ